MQHEPDFEESLDEWMAAPAILCDFDDFTIDRLLRQLGKTEQRIAKATQVADNEITEIRAWLTDTCAPLRAQAELLRSVLERAALERRAAGVKSLKLPYGELATREGAPQWEYEDDVLVATLEERGLEDLLRRKVEIDRVALKKLPTVEVETVDADGTVTVHRAPVDPNGEELPVAVVPGDPTVTIKLK